MKLSEANIADSRPEKYYIARIGDNWQAFNRLMDQKAGTDNWTLAWENGDFEDLSFLAICQLIEASYAQHFANNVGVIDAIAEYREVYDMTPQDIADGDHYESLAEAQEIHIQDIVIRRLLGASGLRFSQMAEDLLQVRSSSSDKLGASLSPFWIKFILDPENITNNPLVPSSAKWNPDSVEAFYQSNRRLVVTGAIRPQELSDSLEREFGEAIRINPIDTAPTE